MTSPPASFRVLFVCTANICRSAMGEQLFTAAVGDRPDVTVASAGVRALVGHDLDSLSASALAELGCPVGPHTARQATERDVSSADLVLTATSEHRASVVQLAPLVFRRAFTVREFARLGRDLDVTVAPPHDARAALKARVGEVAGQRGLVEPGPAGEDELGDPFGAPYEVMQRCAVTLRDAVDETVRILGLGPAAGA